PSQQALKLAGIEPVTANHRAVQEKHRHVQRKPPLEEGVGIYIHHLDGRQLHEASECLQLRKHYLAEVAIAPVDYGENGPEYGDTFSGAAACARRDRPESARARVAAARNPIPSPP